MTESKDRYRVLLLDDDKNHLQLLTSYLKEAVSRMPELSNTTITSQDDASSIVNMILQSNQEPFPYDIIISDIFMPLNPSGPPVVDGGALRIYDAIKKAKQTENIFLMIMSNRRSDAEEQLNKIDEEQRNLDLPWALTQYPKPQNAGRFNNSTESLLEEEDWAYAVSEAIQKCKETIWKQTFVKGTLLDIVGNDKALLDAKLLVMRVAKDKLVVINGPTGSGKELFAKAIHENSQRNTSSESFQLMNIGTISANLLEAELFGYVKGAFTGANTTRKGVFGRSNNGTVAIDEFGSCSERSDAIDLCLRNVITSPNSYRKIGGDTNETFSGTVILMGSKLEEYIQKRASEDLKSRLAAITRINLPKLADCKNDIIQLAERFLDGACGKGKRRLSEEAKKALVEFDWPGNVRQLQTLMTNRQVWDKRLSDIIDVSDLKKVEPGIDAPRASSRPVVNSTAQKQGQVELTRESVKKALVKHNGIRAQAAEELFDTSSDTEKDNARHKVNTFIKDEGEEYANSLPPTKDGRPKTKKYPPQTGE